MVEVPYILAPSGQLVWGTWIRSKRWDASVSFKVEKNKYTLMPEVPDKNVEINGQVIGASSTVKLSVKTALWIMGGIIALVMTILTYSYFDLKPEVKSSQQEFIEKVDKKVDEMDNNIEQIRLDQADIKGDIKLILDRQTRSSRPSATPSVNTVSPALPPSVPVTSTDTIN